MTLAERYSAAKEELSSLTGASEDLLHLHAGLLILFATALLLKRRLRSTVPIAMVWVFALANEAVDLLSPGASASPWEPVADIANTVFWPTLLFLLAMRRGVPEHPNRTA
jgi:hypothetical protein